MGPPTDEFGRTELVLPAQLVPGSSLTLMVKARDGTDLVFLNPPSGRAYVPANDRLTLSLQAVRPSDPDILKAMANMHNDPRLEDTRLALMRLINLRVSRNHNILAQPRLASANAVRAVAETLQVPSGDLAKFVRRGTSRQTGTISASSAQTAFLNNDYKEAIRQFSVLLATLESRNSGSLEDISQMNEIRGYLSSALFFEGRLSEAILYAEAAYASEPDNIYHKITLAVLYMFNRQLEKGSDLITTIQQQEEATTDEDWRLGVTGLSILMAMFKGDSVSMKQRVEDFVGLVNADPRSQHDPEMKSGAALLTAFVSMMDRDYQKADTVLTAAIASLERQRDQPLEVMLGAKLLHSIAKWGLGQSVAARLLFDASFIPLVKRIPRDVPSTAVGFGMFIIPAMISTLEGDGLEQPLRISSGASRKLLKGTPYVHLVDMILAQWLMRRGKDREAYNILRGVPNTSDATVEWLGKSALLMQVKALSRLGENNKASILLDNTLKIMRNTAESAPDVLDMADSFLMVGQFERAEALYTNVLSRNDSQAGRPPTVSLARIYAGLAQVNEGLGRYPDAEDYWRKDLDSLRENPDESGVAPVAAALYRLARVLCVQQRHQEAVEQFRSALAIEVPHYGPTHFEVGRTQYALGGELIHNRQYIEAVDILRSALASHEMQTDNPERVRWQFDTLTGFGTALLTTGEYASAQKCFLRAKSLMRSLSLTAEDRFTMELGLARSTSEIGQYSEALKQFETIKRYYFKHKTYALHKTYEFTINSRIAEIETHLGKWKRADERLRQLREYEDSPEMQSTTRIQVLALSVVVTDRLQRRSQAAQLGDHALKVIQQRDEMEWDTSVVGAFWNLSEYLHRNGRAPDALKLERLELGILRQSRHSKSPELQELQRHVLQEDLHANGIPAAVKPQ